MYIAVRQYDVVPGTVEEWMHRVECGLVPLLRQMRDFRAYYAVKVRDDQVVTISIFETQEGAEASERQSTAWMTTHLASLHQGFPRVTGGDVQAHSMPLSFPERTRELSLPTLDDSRHGSARE